jgi:hypothetical protein
MLKDGKTICTLAHVKVRAGTDDASGQFVYELAVQSGEPEGATKRLQIVADRAKEILPQLSAAVAIMTALAEGGAPVDQGAAANRQAPGWNKSTGARRPGAR